MILILSVVGSSAPTQPSLVIEQAKTANATDTPASTTPSASPTTSIQNPTPQNAKKRTASESIQNLVVMDLARILEVDEAEILVIQFSAAIWSEAQLGCAGRKGLHESTPIPGYKILLQYRDQFYEYHTDNVGNFRLCSPPTKPLEPIK
jgi:hypothetical protein